MRDEADDLTPEQEAKLDELPREAKPPAELEERVVATLRERALVRPAASWRRRIAIAALLILGLSGAYFAGFSAASSASDDTGAPGIDTRPVFALLIYDPPRAMPAEELQSAVQEASTWAGELAAAGVLVAAEKLRDEGSRLIERGGEVQLVADFPPPEATLVLGGFFLIRAADYREAQRIAADCPLLRFGSTIEVRAFEEI